MPGSNTTNSYSTGATTTSGSSSTAPWAVQTPYLTNAFSAAQAAYDKNMANGPYSGEYVAQDNGQQAAAYNQAYNFGTSASRNQNVSDQLGASQGLMDRGAGWAQTGASGLAGLAGDQTGTIINNATRYADDPYISNAVRGAMLDANRNAAENDVPNLYRSAANSNTLNSDRAALAQGVVERGLAERAAALSAGMRENAYQDGIDTSANEINNQRSAYSALGTQGQGMFGLGQSGYAQGVDNQSRLNQMAAAGGAGNQQIAQDRLNNAMAKYEGNQNFPWSALQNYYNIVGNRNWGGTTNYTQTGSSANSSTATQMTDPGVSGYLGAALGGVGSMLTPGASGVSPLGSALKMAATYGQKGLAGFL